MRKASLLSIGINEYDNFQTLGLCAKDSETLAKSFSNRYPELEVEILNDQCCIPSSIRIKEQLQKLEDLTYSENDTVVLFYAGHGFAIDGKDYLTAKETAVEDLSTAISTDDIVDSLKRSGAGNIVVIIDACRAQINRAVNRFGERTAELSRRKGVVTYFSCSPGETAKELAVLQGGIFTHTFTTLLDNNDIPFTPFIFNSELIVGVKKICADHKLGKQTPYTAVAPLEKATFDVFSGRRYDNGGQKKEIILVLGPSNAGKTTIGQYLAREHGYVHAEMSSYAWQRYNNSDGFKGSILDFMESEVWSNGHEDAIAQDLISSDIGASKIVVCGARRMEEVETIFSQDWDVRPLFVFANASDRYDRIKYSSGRYGPSYKEFIRKDLKEFSWGIANMIQIKNIELIVNESGVDDCLDSVGSFSRI